jgi:hypothetical protein
MADLVGRGVEDDLIGAALLRDCVCALSSPYQAADNEYDAVEDWRNLCVLLGLNFEESLEPHYADFWSDFSFMDQSLLTGDLDAVCHDQLVTHGEFCAEGLVRALELFVLEPKI